MVPPAAQNRAIVYIPVKMEFLSFLFPVYADHHASEGKLAQFVDQEHDRVRLEHRKGEAFTASTHSWLHRHCHPVNYFILPALSAVPEIRINEQMNGWMDKTLHPQSHSLIIIPKCVFSLWEVLRAHD